CGFLVRVWRRVDHWAPLVAGRGSGLRADGSDNSDGERAIRRKTHDTIRRATADIEERMHLNTAVSSMMELVNELYAFSETTPLGQPSKNPPSDVAVRPQTIAVMREALDALVVMLSPFAPHTAEELWHMLGHADGLTRASWPTFDP